MKIEKGNIYYNGKTDEVFRADKDIIVSDFVSEKTSVHCPTKEDWDYVVSIFDNGGGYNYNSYKSESVIFLDSGMYGNLNGITNQGYHTITIDQFKQFYNMKEQTEPKYFAISKEEWQEYQELKSKKQAIDYDKLRTGSRVKVNLDRLTMATKKAVTSDDICVVVLIDSPYMVNSSRLNEGAKNSLYTSLLFKGNYIHAVSTSKNYITEVIEY